MKKTLLILTLAFFLISFASASIYCDKVLVDNSNPSVSCTNDGNVSVSVTKVGTYFTIDKTNIPSNSTVSITTTIQSGSPVGNLGAILFDGSNPINVNNNVEPQLTGCQLNPSLVWNVPQQIQLGTSFDTPLIIFEPTECSGSLSLSYSNVHVSGGITTNQGQKPVALKTVSGQGVILSVNTDGLNTQTYASTLDVVAFGKTFQYPFNVLVTSGTSTYGNFSLDNLPVCSVSQVNLALNNTYSVVCTQVLNDVSIEPVVDTDYLIGVKPQITSSQIIWYFKPVKMGDTKIKINFKYNGYLVGTPFLQDVRITSSGIGAIGSNIKPIFTPSLDKARSGEEITIQVSDNSSGSLIGDSQIFVNSKKLNTTDGYTYTYIFYSDLDYEFRFLATGYADLIQTLRLTSQPMEIKIDPENGDTSSLFNITTGDVNATLFLDGNKINNPFLGTLTQGNHTIRAIAQGYFETEKNISVELGLTAYAENFKKGVETIIFLSRNTTWQLNYLKSIDSNETVNIASGEGSQIIFKPDKKGIYQLYAEDKLIFNQEIGSWDGIIFWGIKWYYFLIILAGILGLGILIIRNRNSGDASKILYGRVNN